MALYMFSVGIACIFNLGNNYLDEGGDGSIGDRHDCRLTLKYMYDLATLTKSEPGSRSQ